MASTLQRQSSGCCCNSYKDDYKRICSEELFCNNFGQDDIFTSIFTSFTFSSSSSSPSFSSSVVASSASFWLQRCQRQQGLQKLGCQASPSPDLTLGCDYMGQGKRNLRGSWEQLLGSFFGRTDFLEIFVFEPLAFLFVWILSPDLFFFSHFCGGKSAQKDPPGKSPTESSKINTTKMPDTFLQRSRASNCKGGREFQASEGFLSRLWFSNLRESESPQTIEGSDCFRNCHSF